MRDRIPAIGKANRVRIRMDNGQVIEGVLEYADDAVQSGSVYNKANVLPDTVCDALEIDRVQSEPKDAFLSFKDKIDSTNGEIEKLEQSKVSISDYNDDKKSWGVVSTETKDRWYRFPDYVNEEYVISTGCVSPQGTIPSPDGSRYFVVVTNGLEMRAPNGDLMATFDLQGISPENYTLHMVDAEAENLLISCDRGFFFLSYDDSSISAHLKLPEQTEVAFGEEFYLVVTKSGSPSGTSSYRVSRLDLSYEVAYRDGEMFAYNLKPIWTNERYAYYYFYQKLIWIYDYSTKERISLNFDSILPGSSSLMASKLSVFGTYFLLVFQYGNQNYLYTFSGLGRKTISYKVSKEVESVETVGRSNETLSYVFVNNKVYDSNLEVYKDLSELSKEKNTLTVHHSGLSYFSNFIPTEIDLETMSMKGTAKSDTATFGGEIKIGAVSDFFVKVSPPFEEKT